MKLLKITGLISLILGIIINVVAIAAVVFAALVLFKTVTIDSLEEEFLENPILLLTDSILLARTSTETLDKIRELLRVFIFSGVVSLPGFLMIWKGVTKMIQGENKTGKGLIVISTLPMIFILAAMGVYSVWLVTNPKGLINGSVSVGSVVDTENANGYGYYINIGATVTSLTATAVMIFTFIVSLVSFGKDKSKQEINQGVIVPNVKNSMVNDRSANRTRNGALFDVKIDDSRQSSQPSVYGESKPAVSSDDPLNAMPDSYVRRHDAPGNTLFNSSTQPAEVGRPLSGLDVAEEQITNNKDLNRFAGLPSYSTTPGKPTKILNSKLSLSQKQYHRGLISEEQKLKNRDKEYNKYRERKDKNQE